MNEGLLREALMCAVPLWIEELRGESWENIQARAQKCVPVIAEKGDIILFKSSKKGETAEAFNRLAEAVACLALFPGGIDVFGLHFEAELSEGGEK